MQHSYNPFWPWPRVSDTCLQWQCGCLHPCVQTVLFFISWILRHMFWHLCLSHTEFKYVLGPVLSKMVCGLIEREIECKLQHTAVTCIIPCELWGIIMFFYHLVNFTISPILAAQSPLWTDCFMLCNEAVQSPLPLIAYSQQI